MNPRANMVAGCLELLWMVALSGWALHLEAKAGRLAGELEKVDAWATRINIERAQARLREDERR